MELCARDTPAIVRAVAHKVSVVGTVPVGARNVQQVDGVSVTFVITDDNR
jgi:hypothetical protein